MDNRRNLLLLFGSDRENLPGTLTTAGTKCGDNLPIHLAQKESVSRHRIGPAPACQNLETHMPLFDIERRRPKPWSRITGKLPTLGLERESAYLSKFKNTLLRHLDKDIIERLALKPVTFEGEA